MALLKFRRVTRAEYDDIVTKDANTRYTVLELDGSIAEYIGSTRVSYSTTEVDDKIIAIEEINYNDLVSLRDSNNLKKGAFYRIIDYETTTVQPETRSAEHYFDVIVQALDEKTLSENAQAIHSERDTDGYFAQSRLEAWQLKYKLDNDNEYYYWADDVNGKGVIYQMIDEFCNDLPYDFKNIQFKRYKIETYTKNTDLENKYYALKDLDETVRPSGAVIDDEDFIWAYTFTVIDENSVVTDVSLNKNKTFTDDEGTYHYTKSNKFSYFDYSYYDDVLEQSLLVKALGNNVILYDYSFYDYWEFYGFSSNTIGNNFRDNTIGKYFSSNRIEDNFSSNTIGDNFKYNTIGNNFSDNNIGNEIRYITFSVDGTDSSQIKYLYLKSELSGTSIANKLDLYFEGLYGRTYHTTFEIIANDNIVSSWEETPLTRAGKVKATKITATWADI